MMKKLLKTKKGKVIGLTTSHVPYKDIKRNTKSKYILAPPKILSYQVSNKSY